MFAVQQFKNIMNYKQSFVATLYFWGLSYFVFALFNGLWPFSWKEDAAISCGILMVIIGVVSHVIPWDQINKRGGK